MKRLIPLYFLVVSIVATSCKTHQSTSQTSTNSGYIIKESIWNDSISKIKEKLKTSWTSFYNPKGMPEFLKNMKYNLPADSIDSYQFEMLPIQTYILDSTSLSKVTKNTDILSLLSSSKNLLKCFVIYKETIYFHTDYILENNRWEIKSNGPVFKEMADTLSINYFKRKSPILQVYLEYRSIDINNGRPFGLVLENNEVYCLKLGGIKKRFVDELLEIKEAIKNKERW